MQSASLYNVTTLNGRNTHGVIEIAADINPQIANFHIENGQAQQMGVGFLLPRETAVHTITNNIIRDNTARKQQRAAAASTMVAASYDRKQRNLQQHNQWHGSGGGGILVDNDTATISSTIRFNQIHDNQANGSNSFGGGIFIDGDVGAFIVANYIYSNTGRVGGGIGTASQHRPSALCSAT